MRIVWLLLRKDLLRRLRSPLGVLVMLAFPIAFSGMLALAFGGGSDSGTGLPAAKLLLHDQDAGLVGDFLKDVLQAEQLSEYVELVEVGEEGVQMMENGEASALLTIPEGTTEALFDGDAVTFQLVRNPTQFILPEITEQILATLTDVASVVTRILHREADALQVDLGDAFDAFDAIDDADFAVLALRARKLLSATGDFIDSPPLDFEVVDLGAEEGAESDGEEEDENNAQVAIFLFILPGIAVYSLFVIGDQMMRDVVREGQLGTLRRQLTAPIRISQVILGKVLLSAAVAGLALLILAAVMLFLVDVEVQMLAFGALSLALLLAISGFAAAIYGLVPNETRGSTFSSLLYLIMAFSGGSFVPLDNMPTAVQSVAHISPFYWGTQGFQKLLNGGGLADVAPAMGVLGGLGFVLLLVGMGLLHRHALKGSL